MEAYVWACTDAHLGVCLSTRVFGSLMDAQEDAQENIGDAVEVVWTDPMDEGDGGSRGDFVDTNGCEGVVRVALVKVRL